MFINKPKRIITEQEKFEAGKRIAQMRERDSELVTGIFKNLENPGGSVQFMFCLYPGDDYVGYHLADGERYQLPRGVARHLNMNCYYKEYKHLTGQYGETGMRAGFNDGRMGQEKMQEMRKVHRYAFHSLEFMDDDIDMKQSNVVQVQYA